MCTRKKLNFSAVGRIFPVLLPHPIMRQRTKMTKIKFFAKNVRMSYRMSQVLVSSSSTQSAMEHQYGGWSRLSWRYANFVSWVKTFYKLDVPQSLMLHDIVVKRKSILDQLRKGRSTLGVLAEIEDNPSLFEEFFVHQGGLSNDFVLKCLHFQDSCKQNVIEDRVYQMFQTFVIYL